MPRELFIATRRIADDEPCYVVAEIGSNHCGSVDLGKRLIAEAAAAGASAVKFQKRDNKRLYAAALYDKPYEHPHSYGRTYGEHRERLELDRYQLAQLFDCAHDAGLHAFATPFDEVSADVLMKIGMPAFKLHSGGLTDLALARHLAGFQLPILASTGGGTVADIDRLVNTVVPINPRLALLHCTASYPCAFEELNLQCIPALRERYPELVIGWSGHDHGIAMAVVAYTLGARIIEKHFTLNRVMKGTDHAMSLEPPGLRRVVRDLERARVALGDGVKRYYASERGPIAKMRRRESLWRPPCSPTTLARRSTEYLQITGAEDALSD